MKINLKHLERNIKCWINEYLIKCKNIKFRKSRHIAIVFAIAICLFGCNRVDDNTIIKHNGDTNINPTNNGNDDVYSAPQTTVISQRRECKAYKKYRA